MSRVLWVIVAVLLMGAQAAAQDGDSQPSAKPSLGPSTSLPLPRFVTLKKDQVYMRRGPGADHPIEWVYVRKHMPLEVVNEYELWREVRDADGTQGWVSANMLSGDRYVMVTAQAGKDHRWPLHKRPDPKSDIVAIAQPGVIAELNHCPDAWCQITAGNRSGWIERAALWGVLEDERIE